eukprot:363934-Chlamydomonas_euryale.AAC.1
MCRLARRAAAWPAARRSRCTAARAACRTPTPRWRACWRPLDRRGTTPAAAGCRSHSWRRRQVR